MRRAGGRDGLGARGGATRGGFLPIPSAIGLKPVALQIMAIGRRERLATVTRRALTGVAIVAQLLLLLAPLVELHDHDAGPRAITGETSAAGAAMVAGQPSRGQPHNATTCPACIAQSLHAQLASGVRLPTAIEMLRLTSDLRDTFLPHHDSPSTHRSRAPPVVS